MADPCEPCPCTPYDNLCCCPSQNGITVTQPLCQVLPDGSTVTNPCFNVNDNISYWSYKFITNCDQGTNGISGFVIPICENIPENDIIVEEKIDGCGEFTEVAFELNNSFNNYGDAPVGFNFLKVENTDRYDVGVCVLYRVSIGGNFPVSEQSIKVKAATPVYEFSCDDCYKVPGCPQAPKLLVVKQCEKEIDDNVILTYTIDVSNIGNTTLTDVQFEDTISYDGANIIIDSITTEPLLDVNQDTPGLILITGNLGELDPGESTQVKITVTILSFNAPGTYQIMENAKAACCATEASDSCNLNIEVVQLRGEKCCTTGDLDNTRIFRLEVFNVDNSPQTNITILDTLTIPSRVTVRFNSFSGCNAVFADTMLPVQLNTDVSNKTILISCENLTVPAGGSISKNISFDIVSTTAFSNSVQITNNFDEIIFLNTGEQVLLNIQNIPDSAAIEVLGNSQCLNPCQ